MPSSPYIEVSQETRARIAELRRRASADEGRRVSNEEIVAQEEEMDRACEATRGRFGIGDIDPSGIDCNYMPCRDACPFRARGQ